MKKIAVILSLIFLCGKSFSQGFYYPTVVTVKGEHKNRIKIDSTFLFVTGCTTPSLNGSSSWGMAAFFFDSCNHRLWVYDPKTSVWDTMHIGVSGSGSGWGFTGNSGTTAGTNFIGTTDNVDWY